MSAATMPNLSTAKIPQAFWATARLNEGRAIHLAHQLDDKQLCARRVQDCIRARCSVHAAVFEEAATRADAKLVRSLVPFNVCCNCVYLQQRLRACRGARAWHC